MKIFTFLMTTTAALNLTMSALAAPPSGDTASTPAQANVAATKNAPPKAAAVDSDSPYEKPNTTYLFVGLRFRYVIVPKFYTSLFADGGTTVGAPAFGPEFTIRQNRFEYVLSAMYASYAMDPTPFKSKSDNNLAWELVDSSIKSLYLMSDFSWSSPIDPKFSVLYGAGFGIGIIFGELHRVQAYPGSGGVNDPYSYRPCVGPSNPDPNFCNPLDSNHFANYSEPSWASGGSKPIVFPWLSLQTGIRFKPTRQIMARLDVGWNIFNGPFFGLAGNYGL
jgi:hypothetical protein